MMPITVIETVEIPSLHKPAPTKLSKETTLTNVFDEEKKVAGSAGEAVQRRMRGLKKRLTKIEKYEAMTKNTLNKDQLEAIAKKPEVIFALKELEDMMKQISVIETEEQAKTEKMKQDLIQESQLKIKEIQKENSLAKENYSKALLRLFFALNYLLPSRLAPTVTMTKEQFAALGFFRAVITGDRLDMVENVDVFALNAADCLDKYFSRDSQEFVNGVSYQELEELVERILNPPAAPQFVAQVDMPVEETIEPVVQVPHTTISFINPSEVLGVQDWSDVPVEDEQPKVTLDVKVVRKEEFVKETFTKKVIVKEILPQPELPKETLPQDEIFEFFPQEVPMSAQEPLQDAEDTKKYQGKPYYRRRPQNPEGQKFKKNYHRGGYRKFKNDRPESQTDSQEQKDRYKDNSRRGGFRGGYKSNKSVAETVNA